jgi:phosphatidylserine decarboxylase
MGMIGQLSIGVFQSVIISALAILLFFFRDPERIPPLNEKSILSPADGTILYIKRIEKGEFPFAVKGRNKIPLSEFTQGEVISENGIQVGIGMNFLNVHVNRAPIDGRVIKLKRIPGNFFSLRHLNALLENERVVTIIEGDGIKVVIVQIASRLVRRIVSCVEEGYRVARGERIGAISFGSQVDLLFDAKKDLRLHVKEKEEVKAGISIIATYTQGG